MLAIIITVMLIFCVFLQVNSYRANAYILQTSYQISTPSVIRKKKYGYFSFFFRSFDCFNLRTEYIHWPIKKNDPLLLSAHSLHRQAASLNMRTGMNGEYFQSRRFVFFFRLSFRFFSLLKSIENNISTIV